MSADISIRALIVGALTLLITACSQQDSTDTATSETPAAPPVAEATEAEAHPGKGVYEGLCASCHDGGVDKAPHLTFLNMMSADSIYEAMTTGVMAPETEGLSEQEKTQVAEWLSGGKVGESAEVQLPMCAADNRTPDFSQPVAAKGWGHVPGNARTIGASTAGFSKEDVKNLELKWVFAFPNSIRARSQPTVAAGTIFVGGHDGSVFALDEETGCVRWTFRATAEVRTGIVVGPYDPADADDAPRLYFGDIIGKVYAVDARDGSPIWSDKVDDHPNATITGTPSLHDGKLYVSVSSLEVTPAMNPDYPCCTFRGSVLSYDATTGQRLWKSYTIEQEPRLTGQNSAGTDNFGPSGAGIWNSPAIDAKRNQLYVGTTENFSSPATLTSDAIIAFDLETGKINWAFQATPNDVWNTACDSPTPANCPPEGGPDFDFGAGAILLTRNDGSDVVVGGQKSGLVHAVNPDTGELIWQTRVGRGGIQGGIHFGIAAKDDKVFVPISDMKDGRTYPDPDNPGLFALDSRTGAFVWEQPAPERCGDMQYCSPGISQAITVINGVVFAGHMDGWMRAHDAETGELLWEVDTNGEHAALGGQTARGGSFSGGSGPVAANGKLLISSGYGIYNHMAGNALMVFAPADPAGPADETE